MTSPVTFDPNGIYARASSTCDRRGAAFEVFAPAPLWAVLIRRGWDFALRLAGLAFLLFIAFGLIAMVQS